MRRALHLMERARRCVLLMSAVSAHGGDAVLSSYFFLRLP